MGASRAIAHRWRLGITLPQRPHQALGDAAPTCRRPVHLPAHDAWQLWRGELPRSRPRVWSSGQVKPDVFVCVLDHGLAGHGLRAPRERRCPARQRPDICGGRARGDICRGLPLPFRLLGAPGDLICASGMAAPRSFCRGSRVPLPSGPRIRGAPSLYRDRAAFLADWDTCFRGHGCFFRRCGLDLDPPSLSPQRGGPASGGMASRCLSRGHRHGARSL